MFFNGNKKEVFMKKIIYICVIIIAIVVTYYLVSRYDKSNNLSVVNENVTERNVEFLNSVNLAKKDVKIDMSKITMTIKEGTLTAKGATVIITDTNEEHAVYCEYFVLEQERDNKWVEVDKIDNGVRYVFHEIALLVGDDNKLETTMNWENLYGTLEQGHYRIGKRITDKRRL